MQPDPAAQRPRPMPLMRRKPMSQLVPAWKSPNSWPYDSPDWLRFHHARQAGLCNALLTQPFESGSWRCRFGGSEYSRPRSLLARLQSADCIAQCPRSRVKRKNRPVMRTLRLGMNRGFRDICSSLGDAVVAANIGSLAQATSCPNKKPGSWPGFCSFSGADGREDLRREGHRRHGERR
jgi:hypothetical protein